MTQEQLLGLIGMIIVLTAPAAILAYLLLRQLWFWLRWQLPLRHLVPRGWREVRAREGKQPEDASRD